jgi:RHS repeat-associated protein
VSGVQTLANPRRIKAAHRRRRKVASGQSVQRYYDPGIGRFLSVDPVTANPNTGANFNRYAYANNNPYKFTDPDGRCSEFVNGIVGGLPCELQQRNLNPAHVAADEAASRDAYLVAAPMVTPAAAVAAIEAGPVAVVGVIKAAKEVAKAYKNETVRAVVCLTLSLCPTNPAKPRDAVTGEVERKPTMRVVDALRRRAEQNDNASRSTRGNSSQQSASGKDGKNGFQGVFRVEGRIDSRRLDRELKGK